jgi:hypothetical protein
MLARSNPKLSYRFLHPEAGWFDRLISWEECLQMLRKNSKQKQEEQPLNYPEAKFGAVHTRNP